MRRMNNGIRSVLPLRPCPWWCTETARDHRTGYDSRLDDLGGVLQRIHAADLGAVSVVQTEVNRRGVVSFEGLVVMIEEQSCRSIRARELARDLESAADLFDRISAR